MTEEELRKICREEFLKNVMNNLDSSIIYTYISNLENRSNKIKEFIKEQYIPGNIIQNNSLDSILLYIDSLDKEVK